MDELLVFSNNKTGDKVGVYYNTWLFITEYHWAMLGAYGEQYWLKGISAQMPIDYDQWYDDCIKEYKLHNPIKWF